MTSYTLLLVYQLSSKDCYARALRRRTRVFFLTLTLLDTGATRGKEGIISRFQGGGSSNRG